LNKRKVAHLPIIGDVGQALRDMVTMLDEPAYAELNEGGRYAGWIHQIEEWREQEPLRFGDRADAVLPQYAIQRLWRMIRERGTLDQTIVTTGVGQHQMWAAQYFQHNAPRNWITSGGLGPSGFGLP